MDSAYFLQIKDYDRGGVVRVFRVAGESRINIYTAGYSHVSEVPEIVSSSLASDLSRTDDSQVDVVLTPQPPTAVSAVSTPRAGARVLYDGSNIGITHTEVGGL